MTCTTCLDLLDDLLDDELDGARRAEVESHLETCRSCAAEHASLRDLVGLARELPRGVSGPDRWEEVAAELTAPIPARTRTRVPLIAVLAAAALLVWAFRPAPVDPTPTPTTVAELAPELIDTRLAVAELEAALAARTDLDPEVQAVVDANLAAIDAAIAELERALDARPDARLHRALARVYGQKLAVLERVVQT